jgi:hypothetical protein
MSLGAKEWVLHPETEYRFELDAGTSISIRVSVAFCIRDGPNPCVSTLAHSRLC